GSSPPRPTNRRGSFPSRLPPQAPGPPPSPAPTHPSEPSACSLLGHCSVRSRSVMRRAALLIGYLAALLALDHFATYPEQLGLGLVTWPLLVALAWQLPVLKRAMVLGVVCFATIGEVTGSLVWGVYRYRLHNLPLFIPPAHGLVYLTGIAIAAAL